MLWQPAYGASCTTPAQCPRPPLLSPCPQLSLARLLASSGSHSHVVLLCVLGALGLVPIAAVRVDHSAPTGPVFGFMGAAGFGVTMIIGQSLDYRGLWLVSGVPGVGARLPVTNDPCAPFSHSLVSRHVPTCAVRRWRGLSSWASL